MNENAGDVQERVAADLLIFLRNEILKPRHVVGEGITYQTPLLKDAILDSVELLEMVTFIESKYNVLLENVLYDINNLRNIEAIAGLVCDALDRKPEESKQH